MSIDWAALGIVSLISVGASVVFVVLLSFGIRLISTAKLQTNRGETPTAALPGYALLATAGVLVLFCLYLIIPQFH